MSKEFEDFMRDVPRGDSTRYLSQQRPPQARWMQLEEISQSPLLSYDPENPGKKILIGALGDQLLGIEDDRHILTTAGSRSGKSVGLVSNLLFYRGSVMATDPKGELAILTAERRAEMGQDIRILDPFSYCPDKFNKYRASYNPMSVLKLSSATFLEDAALIAESMVIQPKDPKDQHWDESAKNFIEGVIAHVATSDIHKERRNLITVRELINMALWKPPQEEEEESKSSPPLLYDEMLHNAKTLEAAPETHNIGAGIKAAAIDFFSKKGGEISSVYSTILRHTKFLDYAAFQNVLRDHDFDLSELKTNPDGMSVYLCFPATKIQLANRWMRIFVNQLLESMEREKTVPAIPVLACLDEFPVLGYMKQLETAAGLIASFDVKLWVILQDWSQGKALYGDRWETFAGNAGVMQFFGNNDLATTEYVSRKLGKTQVEITRSGETGQKQQEDGLSGKSETTQIYDLLTPDEISRMFARDDRLKRQLILWAGKHPMMIERVEHFNKSGPLAKYL